MSDSFDLVKFVDYLKENPAVRPNNLEGAITLDNYTKRVRIDQEGMLFDRYNFTSVRFSKYKNGIQTNENYSTYYNRVNKFAPVAAFFKIMGEEPVTSAKNLITIICALLNKPEVSNAEIAQSVEEYFINKKLSGYYAYWMEGIEVEDLINVNGEWKIRPIKEGEISTTAEYNGRTFPDDLLKFTISARSILEIPFYNEDRYNENRASSYQEQSEARNDLLHKIKSFLGLYNIGYTKEIKSYVVLNTPFDSPRQSAFLNPEFPLKSYKIPKSEEPLIIDLWQELKEVLPTCDPPYEQYSTYKEILKKEIVQKKGTSEAKRLQKKLDLEKSEYRDAWLAHAIFSRFYLKAPSSEERVHHFTSALESVLVLDTTDTNYKFKTRGAGVMHLFGFQSGSKIFEILGNIYKVRSTYVHGGRQQKLELIDLALRQGPIYTRNVILLYYLYLKENSELNMPDKKKEKLRKGFATWIEYSLFDKSKRQQLEEFIGRFTKYLLLTPAED